MPRISIAAAAVISAAMLAGCAGAAADPRVPPWRPVDMPAACDRMHHGIPDSMTDLSANEAFASLLEALAPRVQEQFSAEVTAYARAQRAYALALANEPDVFAIRLRALARAQQEVTRLCGSFAPR